MSRRNVEIISCDWCGRDLAEKESSYFINVNGEQNEEICSHCYHRLEIIRSWKETKKKRVALNFNSFIETTLDEDAAAAYNGKWVKYGGEPKKQGENWKTQLHDYCRTMTPAFEKMIGSYQGVAFPFEIRIAVEELREVKEDEND